MEPPDAPVARLAKPLMVYDGNCHFCRRWIARWNEITTDRVDYRPLQAAADFPHIPREAFEHEVKLIEPDGRVLGGAAAVFQVLDQGNGAAIFRLAQWVYANVALFRIVTEAAYHFVARHRTLFSTVTRWLWGEDVRAPTYFTARTWYLRLMGFVYLLAFVSLRAQVDGLIGRDGILPFHGLMDAARSQLGALSASYYLPTLFWLTGAGDGALHFLCYAGMVLAGLLLADVAPAVCLGLLWMCYLSLVPAGQVFLGFQWDILLLEAGFLSLFVAPLRLLPRWGRAVASPPTPLPRTAVFLLRWLLFRLMLMSGVVKLTSGDETWRNFSSLYYHYETQPLPTWVGWWAYQLPHWFQTASVGFVFVAELVAPFLIFGPRRVRLAGCILLALLQVLIAVTGNYGFFNLLTLALCVLLIDDLQWPRRLSRRPEVDPQTRRPPQRGRRWPVWLLAPVAAVYLLFGSVLLWQACFPETHLPPRLAEVYDGTYGVIEPFHSLNGYGLFSVMTRERPEIVIEGSNDREHWLPYSFRWKPGALGRAPAFVAPYMPRLDWQMWFAALGTYRDNRWFVQLMVRLLQGSVPVTRLLAENPFPAAPPRYVRAVLYDYHFTDLATRRRTGEWWRREERGLYCPELSLKATAEP